MGKVEEMAKEKVEAPERIYLNRFWGNYVEHGCQFYHERKFDDDIPYVRDVVATVDAPNTRQRAERAARKIWNRIDHIDGPLGE